MIMFRTTVYLLILTFGFSVNAFSQTRDVPKGWKEVKVCYVTFLIPKNLKLEKDATPFDGCSGGYKNKNIQVGFADLYYSDPNKDVTFSDSIYEWISIDGYKANLMTSSRGSRVRIYLGDQNFDPKTTKPNVGMGVWLKKPADTVIARKIIESIRFVKEN